MFLKVYVFVCVVSVSVVFVSVVFHQIVFDVLLTVHPCDCRLLPFECCPRKMLEQTVGQTYPFETIKTIGKKGEEFI